MNEPASTPPLGAVSAGGPVGGVLAGGALAGGAFVGTAVPAISTEPDIPTAPYLGRLLPLVHERGRRRAHLCDGRLLVPEVDHRPALERLYRRLARREIAARLDAAVASVGASYSGLSIRSQRTRWASCSASGGMSFNWRLLLAPEAVLDYVIWHEVCHLEIRDHSRRFWALVDARFPSWREQRRWLRLYGATLVL